MVRILQIDEYTRSEVTKIRKYAVEHPYDQDFRDKVVAGTALPVGDNPEHVLHIHDGYRVVYSIDKLEDRMYHHLSVSFIEDKKYPGQPEVECIMEMFGMGKSLHDLENVWLEEEVQAVNLLKEFSYE